jgi:hypothetical protein
MLLLPKIEIIDHLKKKRFKMRFERVRTPNSKFKILFGWIRIQIQSIINQFTIFCAK